MIQLQHLCGARPQEVVAIRPCEVLTDGDVWLYQPRSHKTGTWTAARSSCSGRRRQAVLRPWLDRDPESYCFVPAETSAWHYRRLRRRTPAPDQAENGEAEGAQAEPGAEVHPAQLSHGGAAGLPPGGHPGLVAAAAAAHAGHDDPPGVRVGSREGRTGHADTKITEIYAERDLELAMRIMREIG